MTPRLVAPLTLTIALSLCASATAARITTDRACYETPKSGSVPIAVTASGLDAGQSYTVTRGGRTVASGTTDGLGNATATITVPRLSAKQNSVTNTIAIVEGANTATTTFGVARLHASFSPTVGSPAALRVRFAVTGFALQRPAPSVYVHEIDPTGRVARTIALGRATGPCGALTTSRRRRLFATPPRHGIWRLQFDTSRAYQRARPSMLFYTLALTVSR